MHVSSYLLCLFPLLFILSICYGGWISWRSWGKSKMHCTNTHTQSYVNHWITILWKTFWHENYARLKFFWITTEMRTKDSFSIFTRNLFCFYSILHLCIYDLQDYFSFSFFLVALQKLHLRFLFLLFFPLFLHRHKRSENFTVGLAHGWFQRFYFEQHSKINLRFDWISTIICQDFFVSLNHPKCRKIET